MQMMDVDKLVPHEKNSYFFDDMSGEAWMAFLESIETSGIIEPIVITESSHVIISGHQRVRAAKHFKMKQVPVTFREDKGEDEILKQLIETNIRQRGIGNTNPVKLMRCEKELERIYSIKNGNNRYTEKVETKFPPKTQAQLAEESGMTPQHWRNIKNIEKLAPEVQDMLERGQVTESAVRGLYKVLTPEQQKEFAEHFADKEKVSGREVDFYKRRIQELSDENNALKSRKPEVLEVERIIEKVPDDYEDVKKKAKQADAYRKDFDNERQKAADERRKNLELQEQIDKLKEQTVLEQNNHDMTASAIMFAMQCRNFIESVGGYVFLSEHLQELPDKEREEYMQSAQAVHDWAQVLLNNIERSTHGILGNSEEG